MASDVSTPLLAQPVAYVASGERFHVVTTADVAPAGSTTAAPLIVKPWSTDGNNTINSPTPALITTPLLAPTTAIAAAPAGLPGGSSSFAHTITAADVMWGSQVLDVLEHPSVLSAGLAVVVIIALQDVSLITGLLAGSVLMGLDLLCTLLWRIQRKLRHWPYALTHCLGWPFITWSILVLFYQQPQYWLWLNVFLWGSVATLMSLTVLYGYPFSRDLLKEKSPPGLFDTPWWTDLSSSLANTWICIFAGMCALSLIPTLLGQTAGGRQAIPAAANIACNYLAPLVLGALGLSATRAMQDSARQRWLLAPGATATVGAGAVAVPVSNMTAGGGLGGAGYASLPGGADEA